MKIETIVAFVAFLQWFLFILAYIICGRINYIVLPHAIFWTFVVILMNKYYVISNKSNNFTSTNKTKN